MRVVAKRLASGLLPLLIVLALGALDRGTSEGLSTEGTACGMALMSLLTAAVAWPLRRRQPSTLAALQASLVSVAEAAIGVVMVFLLAAPLTAMLPKRWIIALLDNDRAADLMASLFVGVGLLVAARAMRRAGVQSTARLAAERDGADARAALAERERALVTAELQVLRAQVEPHFLWNTLANVEYLIRKDPSQAHRMMGQLIMYLRSNVAVGEHGATTLRSEFDSVRAYLGLMQFRMGERLSFELILPEEFAEEAFAPLMLQTLVENAIQHGLEPKQGLAQLRIVAARDPEDSRRLLVDVTDNGIGLQPFPVSRGTRMGLRNVRERLRALHGDAASLSITGTSEGGVRARIDWPLRTKS